VFDQSLAGAEVHVEAGNLDVEVMVAKLVSASA
jgi:hypothetical protein